MSDSIEEELMRLTAAAIWAQRGSLISCVVLQMLPDYDPGVGDLAHGTPGYPFWTVCSSATPQNRPNESFGTLARRVHTVTAVLAADRLVVEQQANMWAYKAHHQKVFRALNKQRFVGNFVSDPNSCLHYGIVQPRSVVEATAWYRQQKYVAALDIVFTTDESPTP